MSDKGLLINAIGLVDIHGSTNIPTVLYYRKNGPVAIGSEALGLKQSRRELNEDFKIDLGNIKQRTIGGRRLFPTASGAKKSAAELTADFIHEVLQHVNGWMAERDLKRAPSIMVAEPLSMLTESPSARESQAMPERDSKGELVSSDWLENYRRNLKVMLLGKGFEDARIKFLPEPFAVFQYYRHGLRHPLLVGSKKINALVVDFGGGTFDVCIVETTREGEIDINDAELLSKAQSAASRPIGGFYVNRMIVEALLRKCLSPKNLTSKLNTGLKLYPQWRRNEFTLAGLSEEQREFIQQLHNLSHDIEDAKLVLSRSITDWRLDSPAYISVPVAIPDNPFVPASPVINCQLSASEFRNVFVKWVWEEQLRSVVKKVLDRGRDQLNAAPITVVLLSGGSANIKWLRELLRRDFSEELSHARILELKDYQEVVAKGLAVECVRRFYRPEGDFACVTYNRLCLLLDPDESGYELKRFQPKSPGLPLSDVGGVLLPSSSALSRFVGQPMRWKVRLNREPSQRLDYYFLRSSFDPNEVGSLQNVEEHTAFTPKDCKYDQALQVELTVTQDGTAIPRFIYKTGLDDSETIATKGRPFYLDMTLGQPDSLPEAYIGLDFGTSNTSVSYVSQASIEVYEKRAEEKSWNDLSGLISSLPYPLAAPLANYVRSDPARLVSAARDFAEAALTIAAYFAYLEYCARKGRGTSCLFKGFPKRSAGPLWKLLQESLLSAGGNAVFCAALRELTQPTLHEVIDRHGDGGTDRRTKELTQPTLYEVIDRFVTELAKEKHGKVSAQEIDTVRPIHILANVLQKVFTDSKFGLFQQVRKERFGKRFQANIRHAVGPAAFLTISKYSGEHCFSEDEAFIVNAGTGLPLQPLIFWNRCPKHPELDCGHCYFFDSAESQSPAVFSFKAAAFPCTCLVSTDNEFGPLANQLLELTKADTSVAFCNIGDLREVEEDSATLVI